MTVKANKISSKVSIAIGLALALYLSSVAYMCIFQRDFIYHPRKEEQGLFYHKIDQTEEVFLTSADGTKIRLRII